MISYLEKEYIKRRVSVVKVLNHFNKYNNGHHCYCPNPMHNDKHPSVSIFEKSNTIYCFTCNIQYDVIKLYATLANLNERLHFIRICNELHELNDEDFIDFDDKLREIDKEIKEEKNNNKDNYIDDYKNYRHKSEDYSNKFNDSLKYTRDLHYFHTKKIYNIEKYLQLRKIKLNRIEDILKKNNIEIRGSYLNNINSIHICDHNKKVKFQRQIEDYLQGNEKAANKKYIAGNTTYTYIKNENADKLAVFEGLYDLLSFLSNIEDYREYDYISLNSTSNLKKLLYDDENSKEGIFLNYKNVLIAFDSDNEGKEKTELLKLFLNELSVDCDIFDLKGHKDINDYFVKGGK